MQPSNASGVPDRYVSAERIVEQVCELYQRGGKPVPAGHAQMAVLLLLSKPPEHRERLLLYVQWAFVNIWPNPKKTKGLYNLMRDGDWDVELCERTLPAVREDEGLERVGSRMKTQLDLMRAINAMVKAGETNG